MMFGKNNYPFWSRLHILQNGYCITIILAFLEVLLCEKLEFYTIADGLNPSAQALRYTYWPNLISILTPKFMHNREAGNQYLVPAFHACLVISC